MNLNWLLLVESIFLVNVNVIVLLKIEFCLVRKIKGFIKDWIKKIWLWSIFFKFWKGSCIFLRYVVNFVCFDGLNLVIIFVFFRFGREKNFRK